MRIISGKYRGFPIIDPNNKEKTRVSKERLREGVFSALHLKVNHAIVLDLFAGSGAFGFEAYSRGAKSVTLVDADFNAVKCMQRTLNQFKLQTSDIKILYRSYPETLSGLDEVYDIVFLDPPYGVYDLDEIISNLFKYKLISEESIIIIEGLEDFKSKLFQFEKVRYYNYGRNHVTLIEGIKL